MALLASGAGAGVVAAMFAVAEVDPLPRGDATIDPVPRVGLMFADVSLDHRDPTRSFATRRRESAVRKNEVG